MKKLYTYLFLAMTVSQSFSQNSPTAKWPKAPNNSYRCFTDEVDSWRFQQAVSIGGNVSFEKWMINETKKIQLPAATERVTPIIYNIPVIFHIIHNGEAAGTGTNIAAG